MLNVVHYRNGIDNNVDDLNDIDDTRNGLLLMSLLHRPLGDGISIFEGLQFIVSLVHSVSSNILQTPNFGLTVNDIPYNLPIQANQGIPASRLTLQHFVTSKLGPVLSHFAPNNSDARQPQDTNNWPPAVILDIFYASAAVRSWGPKTFIKFVREISREYYYNDDNAESDNAMDDDTSGPGDPNTSVSDQPTPRSARYASRTANKMQATDKQEEATFSDVMDGVLALWMHPSRKGQPKGQRTQSEFAQGHDDIQRWLHGTE